MRPKLADSPVHPPEPGLNRWHAYDVEEVAQSLATNLDVGLTDAEAERRREITGPNRLEESSESHWYQVLWRQFTDVLIFILIVAAVISMVVGETTDAITILAIVILNGILGFVQEWKAERALKALSAMLSPHCQVVRDGVEQEMASELLVPGDVVLLATGDHVPADLRITDCSNLKTDESSLTGESISILKQSGPVDLEAGLSARASMAWMGTSVTGGRAKGVVIATGAETEFGRIAGLTESIGREATPLQLKLAVLGKQLGIAALAIALLIAFAGKMMGKPLLEMFLTGVSLAVAVVPEGLPAVVTLTMALGIRSMVRRKALLRRLRAAESLGAATDICTDKTGTLTQNQMTVRRIWLAAGEVEVTGIGYDPAGHFEVDGRRIDYRERSDLLALLDTSLHCNHAHLTKDGSGWHQTGEPTESALVVAAYKAWLEPLKETHPIRELSFSSERKRMTVVERSETGMLAHIKGAPEVILPRCTHILSDDGARCINDQDLASLDEAFRDMAGSGLRTLAIARREVKPDDSLADESIENGLTLLGIVGMLDPPRPEVRGAIELARGAGIRIHMITGDSAETATAIATQVGLPVDRTVTGDELAVMDDADLSRALGQNVVFARTTPEHKLRIVKVLQRQGHIVGMTVDGVNDAPALKKADVGIAMGIRGTDVAKGAADIVLTDDNFSSIVGAVEEGRRQYDNIQKFVRYLLSSNTGEVIAIFANILLGGPLIFLPVQILWMNLITDGMTAVALGLEPVEKTVMQRPPRIPTEAVVDWAGVRTILIRGLYIGIATLLLYQYYLRSDSPEMVAVAQTMAFTGIILVEKANVLNYRSMRSPLSTIGFFSNPWLLIAIAASLALQAVAVYTPFLQHAFKTVPLGMRDWALLLAVAAPIFLIPEALKWLQHGKQLASQRTLNA